MRSVGGDVGTSQARFDYRNQTQRDEAKRLQLHEIPFMLTNVPEVEGVQKLWTDAYLKRAFGNKPQHLLRSKSNHFMYWCVQQCHPRPLPTHTANLLYLSLSFPYLQRCHPQPLTTHLYFSLSFPYFSASFSRLFVCVTLLVATDSRHPPPAVGLASFKVKEAVEEKQQPGLCAAFRARGGVVCPIPERERCGNAQGTMSHSGVQ